jgi:hypothetical protein
MIVILKFGFNLTDGDLIMAGRIVEPGLESASLKPANLENLPNNGDQKVLDARIPMTRTSVLQKWTAAILTMDQLPTSAPRHRKWNSGSGQETGFSKGGSRP